MDEVLARDGEVAVRLMRDDEADYELVAAWRSDPRVLEFYGGRDDPLTVEASRVEHRPQVTGEDPVRSCIILLNDEPIGYLQFVTELIPSEWPGAPAGFLEGAAAIDLFIGEPSLWGQGHGSRALAAMVGHLLEQGASRVLIDPVTSNARAIRAYRKVGFRQVTVMPRRELHEGELRDNLLMVADTTTRERRRTAGGTP
jgi:aminoglycoside 6'-N-acetyltransferase